MPPASNVRKSSAQTMTMGGPHTNSFVNSAANADTQPHRTTASGRAIRANTTRPTNYYARPFDLHGSNSGHAADMMDSASVQPPGFFPALQFFTDAITALPKEVMKQFTLMKEVEAKIHGPNEKLVELIDNLMEQTVPARQSDTGASAGTTVAQGLLTLTAHNSTNGSANVSIINGNAGRHSVQPSPNGSVDGDLVAETQQEKERRQKYHELRMLTHSLLANLDEKNVVLSEANRVLALQQTRLDSVWPHVESEISEEARLGSMTHWAYSDNRQKIKVAAAGAQNRRDVAATNNLAAAASMLHEKDIAQARREAGREAVREKTRGKRLEHAGDSDFDEKPRKAPKLGRGKAAALAAASGLGITATGEPPTSRKGKKTAEKDGLGIGMVRTASTQGKVAKSRETPRSTPAVEPPVKKLPKAKPGPPKKKVPVSAQQSPMLASSPLASSFNPNSLMEPPTSARPNSARLRQNSAATNLRYERVQDEESNNRPPSSAGKLSTNGERVSAKRKIPEATEEPEEQHLDGQIEKQLKEASDKLEREDNHVPDVGGEQGQAGSQSGSNSVKGSNRQSQVGTPRQESSHSGDATAMSRSRSTRSRPNANEDSGSEEPQMESSNVGKHKRNMSNSHLVKQLAPFNRSPDLDRRRSRDDLDEDLDSLDERVPPEEPDLETVPVPDPEIRQPSTRRPFSRRSTVNTLRSSPAPMSRESSALVSPLPVITRGNGRATTAAREMEAREAQLTAPTEAEAEADAEVEAEVEAEGDNENAADVGEDEDEDSEHDPDDPNEPKYCYCNRGSYGEMVACDNERCPQEWFHLGCTELRDAPSEDEKWYCRECKPLFAQKIGRKSKSSRGKGG